VQVTQNGQVSRRDRATDWLSKSVVISRARANATLIEPEIAIPDAIPIALTINERRDH